MQKWSTIPHLHKIAKMEFLSVSQYCQGFLGLPGTKLPAGAVHQG
jgi:hypothetical protein